MKTSVLVPSLLAIPMANPDAKEEVWIGHGAIFGNMGNIGLMIIEKSAMHMKMKYTKMKYCLPFVFPGQFHRVAVLIIRMKIQ